MINTMKKILFLIFVFAFVASAYDVRFSGNEGIGYFTINGVEATTNVISEVSGRKLIDFVSTNDLYECSGLVINGFNWSGRLPYSINVQIDENISPIVVKKPPSGYIIPQNVMAISADCPSNGWGKIIFASPVEAKFVNDGKTYLFPSPISCLTIKAIGGDIEVNTTTNSTQTIATSGDNAVVPISPAVLEDGTSLVINLPIGEIYFKGSGKVNILGAIYE